MDGTPLSIGGGGSGVGPSNRPLPDLNLPPAAEPEPASSSELRETERLLQEAREELQTWEGRLKDWWDEERRVKDKQLQSIHLQKEIQRQNWRKFFLELKREGLKDILRNFFSRGN